MDIDRIAPLATPHVRILPVLHDRVDFGGLASRVLGAVDPAVVAVELPTTMAEAVDTAIARLPELSLVLSEADDDALIWISAPGDPMVEALRWAAEHNRQRVLIDPDVRHSERRSEAFPDSHAMHHLGAETYVEIVARMAAAEPHDDTDALRERGMAHHLKEAAASFGGPVLALVGAAHAGRLAELLGGPTAPPLARQRRSSVLVRNIHPDDMTGILHDPPIAHAVHEHLREDRLPQKPDFRDTVSRRIELVRDGIRVVTGEPITDERDRAHAVAAWASHRAHLQCTEGRVVIDRAALGRCIWLVAAASWEDQTKNSVHRWQRSLFEDFTRRYARVQGMLVPGLYEWVVGARGVGDDNLAWELFSAARCYPWQRGQAEIETARVDGEMLDLGTRRVHFRRRFFKVKKRLVPIRSRPSTTDPADWLNAFDSNGICSYPPEDVVVEDYGRYLQEKAVSILTAENSRSEPFSTSMLDGLDLRETLLRWHEGRIWVQERGRAPGNAGAVVAIFDEEDDGTAYPYLMSWLGEHDQESDMAFYSTDPTQQIVGPGIMRATYGGFMLSSPPGRLYDVWRDRDYRLAGSKAEVLTMAAVDYSEEKLIVHLGLSPPPARMKTYASSLGKRIVHVPLGSVSPITVRKIRVVHILAGHDKREFAKDYVW
jgi:hypothetical protein